MNFEIKLDLKTYIYFSTEIAFDNMKHLSSYENLSSVYFPAAITNHDMKQIRS